LCIKTSWDPVNTGKCGEIQYKVIYYTSNTTFLQTSEATAYTTSTSKEFCVKDNKELTTITGIGVSAKFNGKEHPYTDPIRPLSFPTTGIGEYLAV